MWRQNLLATIDEQWSEDREWGPLIDRKGESVDSPVEWGPIIDPNGESVGSPAEYGPIIDPNG